MYPCRALYAAISCGTLVDEPLGPHILAPEECGSRRPLLNNSCASEVIDKESKANKMGKMFLITTVLKSNTLLLAV